MSDYRILKKKLGKEIKYIVQVFIVEENEIILYAYRDIKEFRNLRDARKFKRDLELKEGIVIK